MSGNQQRNRGPGHQQPNQGSEGKQQKKQGEGFYIFTIDLPKRDENHCRQVDKLIKKLPGELSRRPDADRKLIDWIKTLKKIEQLSFYSKAAAMLEKEEEDLLELLKDLACADTDTKRTTLAEEKGLLQELPAKANIKFRLCLEELRRRQAPPDKRQQDGDRQSQWQEDLTNLATWVNAHSAHKTAVTALLAPLKGTEAIQELTLLCRMTDEERKIYLEIQ